MTELICLDYFDNHVNELLDLIASQMISEENGLDEIVFSNFKEKCGPFDDSVLERFT